MTRWRWWQPPCRHGVQSLRLQAARQCCAGTSKSDNEPELCWSCCRRSGREVSDGNCDRNSYHFCHRICILHFWWSKSILVHFVLQILAFHAVPWCSPWCSVYVLIPFVGRSLWRCHFDSNRAAGDAGNRFQSWWFSPFNCFPAMKIIID